MSVSRTLADLLATRPDKFAMCRSEIEAMPFGFSPDAPQTAFGNQLIEAGYTYTVVRDQDNSKVWLITRGTRLKSYGDLIGDLERAKIRKIKPGLKMLDDGDIRRIADLLKCEIRQHAGDFIAPNHYLVSWGSSVDEYDMEPFRKVGWTVKPKIFMDSDGEEFIRGYWFGK